jgi:hypothetical protein
VHPEIFGRRDLEGQPVVLLRALADEDLVAVAAGVHAHAENARLGGRGRARASPLDADGDAESAERLLGTGKIVLPRRILDPPGEGEETVPAPAL